MLDNNIKRYQSKGIFPDDFVRSVELSVEARVIIEERFLDVEKGERLKGISGFIRWCDGRHFDVIQKSIEYVELYKKYGSFRDDNGLIEMTQKAEDTFGDDCFIDKAYYVDFEKWEIFGRTKLGELLRFAKFENAGMAQEIVETIRPYVKKVIEMHGINAIGYIPPTVKREVQLMEMLKQDTLDMAPQIVIEKRFLEVRVPQKTLRKLSDRIQNTRSTIFVTNSGQSFDTVLLIDDMMGSGATLNEVARKLKAQGIAKKVIGLAVVGALSGFDVISEV